jgi:PPOX class probable F420-dependent enzyme
VSSGLTDQDAVFVESNRVAHLATVDASGNPYVVPVCYAFDGRRFYTPLDEKPKRVDDMELQRVRNIRANHRVSLLIDRYEEDWSRLAWVQIIGTAELIKPTIGPHARALELLRDRYPQYRDMELERHPIIAITPVRVRSWGAI